MRSLRKLSSTLLLAGALGLASLPAWAQVLISGTVYQIDNYGVCILNNGGITYVPAGSATFRRGEAVYGLGDLGVGMDVTATSSSNRDQEYIPVQYYSTHPDWDWPHQVTGWRQDRIYWHNENGEWRR